MKLKREVTFFKTTTKNENKNKNKKKMKIYNNIIFGTI